MSYTRQQIEETVSYIISDSFSDQPSKVQQYIQTSLIKAFTTLTKKNPIEIKFALDVKDPVLFSPFFSWLEKNEISFPENVHYVLKRNGQSVADHGGDLTLIVKKQKDSSKKLSAHYNDIIEALRDFHLDMEEDRHLRLETIKSESEQSDDQQDDEYENYSDDEADVEKSAQESFEDENFEDESDDDDSVEESRFNVAPREEQKNQAAITFERSNRSKSSRALYFEAKKLTQKENEAAMVKAKHERDANGVPAEEGAAVRFANPDDKTVKIRPILHAFSHHQTQCSQALSKETMESSSRIQRLHK